MQFFICNIFLLKKIKFHEKIVVMPDTVLVTGGAGYIGSHACKALFLANLRPIVYDNLSTGHSYAVKWGPLVEGDLFEKEKLVETMRSFGVKAVLHFAASALVGESVQNPGLYYRNNVGGSLSLLEAMKETGVNRLVFSSTCATYGHPQLTPISEEHPQNPINPYGKTKWMIEKMIQDFGIRSIILRYFNAAGADEKAEIGEHHEPETHLLPNLIQSAIGERNEVLVFGTDFPTKDGSAVRDYIHVSDLADAHVLALMALLNDAPSNIYNLGTGVGTSVLELVDTVQKICCKPFPVRLEARRAGDPAILIADATKARRELGWEPKRSSTEQMIDTAWKWHVLLQENMPLLRKIASCASSPT